MQLIRKTKRRLSKTGNSYIYFGLFLCPYCKKEVEKGMSNGGLNKSCGCASSKLKAKTKTIHGESTKRIYHIWTSMKKRCSNKCHEKQYYFNRGIKVYKGWENNYIEFKNWALENGYKDNLTIDRINNDRGYHPKNCRWVTQTINNRKKECIKLSLEKARTIRKIYKLHKYSYSDISKMYNTTKQNIYYVIHNKIWKEEKKG